jgi:hypothetical protein
VVHITPFSLPNSQGSTSKPFLCTTRGKSVSHRKVGQGDVEQKKAQLHYELRRRNQRPTNQNNKDGNLKGGKCKRKKSIKQKEINRRSIDKAEDYACHRLSRASHIDLESRLLDRSNVTR